MQTCANICRGMCSYAEECDNMYVDVCNHIRMYANIFDHYDHYNIDKSYHMVWSRFTLES